MKNANKKSSRADFDCQGGKFLLFLFRQTSLSGSTSEEEPKGDIIASARESLRSSQGKNVVVVRRGKKKIFESVKKDVVVWWIRRHCVKITFSEARDEKLSSQ